MKKLILICILVIMTVLLVGCGKKDNKSAQQMDHNTTILTETILTETILTEKTI